MNNDIYYRPPWTCGKYNADKHVAILFNLLSKRNYFFEDDSADVIRCVLDVGRSGIIHVNEVSNKYNISSASIAEFFSKLCLMGLLSNKRITDKEITNYRIKCKEEETLPPPIAGTRAEELTNNGIQSAYQAYANAVCDNTILTDVMFELTYRCQEQCVHCYNPGATRNNSERSGRGDIEELTRDDYKRIIDDLCDHGLTTATITGGDPFMHPFVWQIIDYLYRKDIATIIYTNGLGLVGKEECLASYYPYKVQCSIYSGDPAVHDKITRTKNSWKRTINVMDKLHELGIPIEVACPIMQTNLKTYFSVKPYMKKYGSSLAFDVMLTDSIDGDQCVSHHLRLTPEQLSVVLLDEDVIQHINLHRLNDDNITDRSFLNGPPCGVLKNSFCINPNGNLTPCCAFNKIIGNIKHQSIAEIVLASDFIKKWFQTKETDYGECFKKEYCYYCYFCPGNNYTAHKEYLNGCENNCYLAKIRYNTAKRYHSGEDILQGKTLEEYIQDMEVSIGDLHREYNKKGTETL